MVPVCVSHCQSRPTFVWDVSALSVYHCVLIFMLSALSGPYMWDVSALTIAHYVLCATQMRWQTPAACAEQSIIQHHYCMLQGG